jgi:hypothetical protein
MTACYFSHVRTYVLPCVGARMHRSPFLELPARGPLLAVSRRRMSYQRLSRWTRPLWEECLFCSPAGLFRSAAHTASCLHCEYQMPGQLDGLGLSVSDVGFSRDLICFRIRGCSAPKGFC